MDTVNQHPARQIWGYGAGHEFSSLGAHVKRIDDSITETILCAENVFGECVRSLGSESFQLGSSVLRIIHFSAAAYGVVRLSLTNRFRICALESSLTR